MVAGAQAAGRSPDSLIRSVYVPLILARDERAAEDVARQPMVHAMALAVPAPVWAAAGAAHPLGADFPGTGMDPAELDNERIAASGKQITTDLLRKLFVFGNADEVLAELRAFVDAGVNHFTIYSTAGIMKPSLAAGYLREQRRLMRLLKELTPGPFGATLTPPGELQNPAGTRRPVAAPG